MLKSRFLVKLISDYSVSSIKNGEEQYMIQTLRKITKILFLTKNSYPCSTGVFTKTSVDATSVQSDSMPIFETTCAGTLADRAAIKAHLIL